MLKRNAQVGNKEQRQEIELIDAEFELLELPLNYLSIVNGTLAAFGTVYISSFCVDRFIDN